MKEIKCPYCNECHLAEKGSDFLDFDTAQYTIGLKCIKCKKHYKVIFNAEGVYDEHYTGEE